MVARTRSKKWLIAYRVGMLLFGVVAGFLAFGAYMVWGINSYYFPHQSHRGNVVEAVVWIAVSGVALAEGIFMLVISKFTSTI